MPIMQNPQWVVQQAHPNAQPPQIPLITVFPNPIPHGATATIYINAIDPNNADMVYSLTADSGPAPQPTADPSIWTWVAP